MAAGSTVFNIPELLDNILTRLSPTSLVRMKGVNKYARNALTTTALKQQLFLLPHNVPPLGLQLYMRPTRPGTGLTGSEDMIKLYRTEVITDLTAVSECGALPSKIITIHPLLERSCIKSIFTYVNIKINGNHIKEFCALDVDLGQWKEAFATQPPLQSIKFRLFAYSYQDDGIDGVDVLQDLEDEGEVSWNISSRRHANR